MPTPFEDFVTLELPKRPTMLTTVNTGFDGDPNVGPPSVVANAPQGTFYFRDTGSTLYLKESSTPGTWSEVGSGGGGGSGGTTAPITWHVETTGNDVTGDGSIGLPFATPAGALTKLYTTYGSRIRHMVSIQTGIGSFPGFLLSGWEMDPLDNSLPCGIRVSGTFVPATLTGGTNTGTATSASSTIAPMSHVLITDSTQTWVVNELKGKMFEFISGAFITTLVPILANTATTVTLPANVSIASGNSYAIRDWGSVITSGVPVVPNLPAVNAVSQTPAAGSVGIGVFNVETAPLNTELRVEGFKVSTPAAQYAVSIQGRSAVFVRCFFGQGTLGCANLVVGAGRMTFSANVINPSTANAQSSMQVSGTGLLVAAQNLIAAGPALVSTGIAGILVREYVSVSFQSSQIDPFSSFGLILQGQTTGQVSQCAFKGGGTGIWMAEQTGSPSVPGWASNQVSGCDISGASIALRVEGWAAVNVSGGTTGTGNTTGMSFTRSAKALITSDVALTGTTEISMDGIATTLATLRAQSPKVLSTAYGTTIWE